jgi:hypothetical protein
MSDPQETPPDLVGELRTLQRQVRRLRWSVIVLAIFVVALMCLDRNFEKVIGGFTAATMLAGGLIGVLVIIFGGARYLEKKFPPK